MALEIFRLVGSVFVDTEKANKSLSKTDEKAAGLGKSLLDGIGTAAKWGAGVAVAAVGVGAKFVSMAGDAETAFAKVKTLLDTGTDMDAYYDSIMKASNETGVAFGDFSESVYNAISASVDAADAVGFVTDAVKLAKGGFTDTGTAVDVLTTAINAYGLSASDAAHISDVLVGTQNAGKTTVDELAKSMGQVIPVANSAGVGIESLSSMYAVLTKNGIATSEAGTGIKAMLAEVTKTGSTTDKALRELTKATYGEAMSFSDLQAEGFTTAEILGMVQSHADKNHLTLKDMFSSTEAATAAMTLMKDGGTELDTILRDLATTSGTTQSAFDTMSQTFDEQLNVLKNNLSNVAIQLGNQLMPIAITLMEWISAHMPEIQAILEVVFGVLQTLISAAVQAIGWLTGTFDSKMPQIQNTVQVCFSAIKGFWETQLKPMLNQLKAFIENVLAPAFEFVFNHLIAPAVQAAFKFISDLWTGTLKPIFDGIINFLTGVFTGNWSQAWSGLVSIVSGVFSGIVSAIKAPINAAIGVINSFIGGLNRIQIPSWVPGIGGAGISIPRIPMLARGGVLEKGQVGLLEGNGAEAVVPLEHNQKWVSAVAREMDNATGGATAALLADLIAEVRSIKQMGIYLDSGKMVGELARPLDKRLGQFAAQKARA